MMHCGCGCGTRKCKGLFLLVFGVLFLLGTTGVWPEFTFTKYWPLPVLLLGLHDLVCKCGSCECCEMPGRKK